MTMYKREDLMPKRYPHDTWREYLWDSSSRCCVTEWELDVEWFIPIRLDKEDDVSEVIWQGARWQVESEGVMNEKEIKLDYIHFVCPVCHTANIESWSQVNYGVQCWKCGAEYDVIVKMERSDKGRDELLKKVQSPFRDWEE